LSIENCCMSYRVYTTEAVILKKADIGEADKLFSFFTKDFGRLEIKAQGARYLKSKLRYHLSGRAILKISFVGSNGEYWRLVGCNEQIVFDNIKNDFLKTKSTERVLSFVERLIQGQQKDEKLWNALVESFVLINTRSFACFDLKKFEQEMFAKFLAELGYGGADIESALEKSML